MKKILLLLFCQIIFSQNNKKDFKTIDLKNEGEIGQLLIKAGSKQDLDSIIFYASKALELSIVKEDLGLQAHAYYRLGTAYIYKEDLVLSEKNIQKCLEIAKKNNLKNFLRESYRMLGIIAGEKDDYNTCIKYFEESLKYATDPQDVMSLKINIAVIYINTNKNDLAYGILREVIDFYKNYKDKNLNKDFLAIAYVNMSAIAPTFKERYDSVNKAIELSTDSKDYDIQIAMMLKKGELLNSDMQYKKAITYLRKAYVGSIKWDYKTKATSCLIALTKSHYQLKQYDKAAAYIDTLLNSKLNKSKLETNVNIIDSLAYVVYFKNKSFEKSFKHGVRFIEFQDSLINNTQEMAYAEFGKKYQTEMKIKENILLKKDMEIKDLKIIKEKNIRYLFSLIAIVAIIVIFFIYYRNKVKTKNNLALLEKNKIISEKNQLLDKANNTKQKLFTIISHDLINPFNTLLGYSQILNDDYDVLREEEKKKYIQIINTSASKNHILVKNLLNWSRSQQKSITVNKTNFDSYQLIEEVVGPYKIVAYKKNIDILMPKNKNLTCYADKNLLNACIGNLISNAIKFTSQNGFVILETFIKDKWFNVAIIDNGIGLTQKQQDNLFEETNSIQGTDKEKGTGLGLLICKEFIELQNGTISVHSQITKGTTIVISLPLID